MKPNKVQLSIAILVVLYAVGLIGTIAFDSSILKLTPINLLVSIFLVGLNHKKFDSNLLVFCAVVFVGSFAFEALGVATGAIFGQYFYGENLGYKLWDTPLLIGINWLMLCYCSSGFASQVTAQTSVLNSRFAKALIAALTMVVLDLLMEQVAPMVDFWYFKNQVAPLQNYTAWFAFSFAFNFMFQQLQIGTDNRVASWLLALQFIFFGSLCVAFYQFP
ncbi:MAG: carotenoid biosynthesis protein [Bacteroidia bacterium]|jgi:putative membrane protein|nr:carotenoid biosynthesis protein [Bacteroidia bacterium]